jgi:hypothetical protein
MYCTCLTHAQCWQLCSLDADESTAEPHLVGPSRTTKGSEITTPAGCSPVAAVLQNTLNAVSTRATTSICAVRAVVTPTAARFARAVHLGAGRSRPIWARPGRPQPINDLPLQVQPHGWQVPGHPNFTTHAC